MTDFDGNRVLIDIKTGASSQKHPLQLAVYAWALQKDGITVDKAGFWDARTGHISEWPIDYLFSERVEDMLNTFDKARKANIFLPNLSNCGRCGVVSYCKYRKGQYSDTLEFNNNEKGTDK
jgi:CRISPR/Cas system-associated exonuclease Cas4 (RecB family)